MTWTGVLLVFYALFWVISFVGYGAHYEAVFLGVEVVTTLALMVLVKFRPRYMFMAGNVITGLLLAGIAVANHATGGLAAANVVAFLLVPVVAQVCLGTKGLWWVLPTLAVAGVFEWGTLRGYEFPNVIPPAGRPLDTTFTWAGALVVLALIVFSYERVRRSWELELQRQRDTAREAAAARSRFLAAVSHEFRTPLNVILGNTNLLVEGQRPGPLRERLELIAKNAYSLLALVEDALDIAHIDSERLEVHVTPFEPVSLVQDVIKALELRVEKKGLQLQVDDRRRLPGTVRGDAFRLRQILLNLLDNAIKFTEVGKVVVTLDDGRPGWLEISVTDSGRGIREKERDKVFRPFFQGLHCQEQGKQGAGLGLAICQRIADALGGKVYLAEQQGPGSRFVVSLPFPLWVPEREQQAREGMVLLVEDDKAGRELVSTVLSRAGYQVTAVATGRAALQLLAEEGKVALVLVDIRLPDMDGIELARSIREHSAGKHLPVLALTAHALPEQRDACLAAGMNDFVTKPVEATLLAETVRRWLGPAARKPSAVAE